MHKKIINFQVIVDKNGFMQQFVLTSDGELWERSDGVGEENDWTNWKKVTIPINIRNNGGEKP